jgi:adenylate cyclase
MAAPKVVLVDDSELVAMAIGEELTSRGYEVICLQDPMLALVEIPRLQPSVVLTDLEMPVLNGAELCRRLKSGPTAGVPVIILTGHETDAVTGLKAGADDYVQKGTDLEELIARMESAIRRVNSSGNRERSS